MPGAGAPTAARQIGRISPAQRSQHGGLTLGVRSVPICCSTVASHKALSGPSLRLSTTVVSGSGSVPSGASSGLAWAALA